MIDLMPLDSPPNLISEYVQGRRIMPTDTPFPGYWNNRRTPYLVEIMDDLSPYSPIQISVTMKSRKLGVTAAAENVCAYWMDASPTRVEYVTATADLAEDWATKRLEPVIDSLGFRHKMIASINNPKSRRTGDKIFSKQFIGGSLNIISAGSMLARRSGDIRVLLVDEIDGVPMLTTTGEGNWLEILLGHQVSWGARKKAMLFSSPATLESSNINRMYELGDCRKFLVPCPYCGAEQELVDDQENHGLKADFESGVFKRAYYLCERCHEAIFNHQKTQMLAGGHWEPTKQSTDPVIRSRQISALYSPVGMLAWDEYYRKRLAAEGDPESTRSFQTLWRGVPYLETGGRPQLRNVIELRGEYSERTIPDGVLYLTAGIDVQRGKEKDDAFGARLEMEVVGHGIGHRTWSILYRRFDGEVESPLAGAWDLLTQFAADGGLSFKRRDGSSISVEIIFIDSGDGFVTDTVYAFCAGWHGAYPIKGFGKILDKSKAEKYGDRAAGTGVPYRPKQLENGQVIYEVGTNYYKTALYNRLNIRRRIPGPQDPGFCDFPFDRPDPYFAGLISEEKRSDGSFHKVVSRNEPLDCRVYALCAGDVYLAGIRAQMQAAAKQQGASPAQLSQITTLTAIQWLESTRSRK